MGLLPCILRSLTSSLLLEDVIVNGRINLDIAAVSSDVVVEMDVEGMEIETETETGGISPELELKNFNQYMELLLWTESVLGLTMALISVTTALPALTDNGVISSIATVLSHKPLRTNKHPLNSLIDAVERDRITIIRLHIDSLVVQILDTAITNHSGSFVAFKDQGGAEAALLRLLDELEILSSERSDSPTSCSASASTSSSSVNLSVILSATVGMEIGLESIGEREKEEEGRDEIEIIVRKDGEINDVDSSKENGAVEIQQVETASASPAILNISSLEAMAAVSEGGKSKILSLPPGNKVLLHQLISLIISWVQDTQQDSSDHLHGQLLKGSLFAQIFGVLFNNVTILSSALISPAVALIADIINNDPAPPGLLSHMLSSGVIELSLRACLDPTLVFNNDLLMSISSLISACCLTQEGIDLVKSINPFPHLFSLLLDEKYYYPHSKTFMTDLPNNFGSSLEELIRHYPTLQSIILNSLLSKLSDVAALALGTKHICSPAQITLESSSSSSSLLSDDSEKVREYMKSCRNSTLLHFIIFLLLILILLRHLLPIVGAACRYDISSE